MLRDFKQNAGIPVEQVLKELETLQNCLEANETTGLGKYAKTARQIDCYYRHYQALTQSAIKDPEKANEWIAMMETWRTSAQSLAMVLEAPQESLRIIQE